MAIFDGTAWTTDGVYTPDAYVYSIAKLPNGNIAVGGVFAEVAGVPALNVAIYDGTQWNEPDGGVGIARRWCHLSRRLCPTTTSSLPGSSPKPATPANNIARYDSSTG